MRPLRVLSDPQLALRIRNGDDRAFEELLSRYADMVSYHAAQFFASGESEDDLEQAARLGLLKAARTYRPDRGSGFHNFAVLAVRAELITFIRTAGRGKRAMLNGSLRWEQVVGEDLELGEITAARQPSPCEHVIVREELAHVVSVITNKCSEAEQVVVARQLNGASLGEAGAGFGRNPEKFADNALQRVRRKLAAAA